MIALHIYLRGDGMLKDLEAAPNAAHIHVGDGAPAIRVGALEGGMASGKPSVAIALQIPAEQLPAAEPGKDLIVLAETSLRLFQMAAVAFMAAYGNQMESPVNFGVQPGATDAYFTFNDEIEKELSYWSPRADSCWSARAEGKSIDPNVRIVQEIQARAVVDTLRWVLKTGPKPSEGHS